MLFYGIPMRFFGMMIIIEKPDLVSSPEEKNLGNLCLTVDLQHLKTMLLIKDYNAESESQKTVEELYRLNHINQTYDFVKIMSAEYRKLHKAETRIWDCCVLLNDVVDERDPDLDEPQIELAKDYPNEYCLHLILLIHDLGKVPTLPSFGSLCQWAVVGDTFPLGCAFDESIVHHKYFKQNPDYHNPTYQTKNGIYDEECGQCILTSTLLQLPNCHSQFNGMDQCVSIFC